MSKKAAPRHDWVTHDYDGGIIGDRPGLVRLAAAVGKALHSSDTVIELEGEATLDRQGDFWSVTLSETPPAPVKESLFKRLAVWTVLIALFVLPLVMGWYFSVKYLTGLLS
jgi:hypothetical protein